MAEVRVFLIDDDDNLRRVLDRELTSRGFRVTAFASTTGVLDAIEENPPSVLLLDLRLPGQGGMEFLRHLASLETDVQVVVLTGHGSVAQAVEAMQLGAHDFLTKPIRLDVLERSLYRIVERGRLVRENKRLRRAASAIAEHSGILGESSAIQTLRDDIERVATSDTSLLIQGENGTGKELVARAVHRLSSRRDQPFVTVNCAAIAESIVESELFGHEKGAFTGADRRRMGLFEAADAGTLFLDEIGDLPAAIQPTLLRALQFGEIRPVGSERTLAVDVRVIVASNRPLLEMMQESQFREDLYYRISTLCIEVPSLRERDGDIEFLGHRFLARAAANVGRSMTLTDEAVEQLRGYDWPGNVRELENAMERLAVMSPSDEVDRDSVERLVVRRDRGRGELPSLCIEELERLAIIAAMQKFDGAKPKAADALGIGLKTLYNKLDKFDLK